MDGNGMDAEAGRIDVVSCGIGFPEDAETLGLIGRADVVYGSRALLAACPVEARLTRIIGAKAREDAADALTLCRAGRHIVVLASGDALYHGFGGTLSGIAHPDDTIVYHPGITAFQALFHRLGLPWQDARLFSAHSGEALPARAIAEAPLSVAYAGSRYPAHAIAQAVLKLHPASAGRAAVIAEDKIKKQGDELTIKMVKNPDIVAGVAALKSHRPYVVGFAAETNNVEEYARQKRARKNLDLICANDVSQPNQGFNSDSNALHLFWQDGEKRLPLERKELLGQLLLDEIVTRYDEKNRR